MQARQRASDASSPPACVWREHKHYLTPVKCSNCTSAGNWPWLPAFMVRFYGVSTQAFRQHTSSSSHPRHNHAARCSISAPIASHRSLTARGLSIACTAAA